MISLRDTAIALCVIGGLSCSMKETVHSTKIIQIPHNGSLKTNFIVPMSGHAFLVIGYPKALGEMKAEIHLVGQSGTNSFTVSKQSMSTTWLRNLGLNSVLVNDLPLTDANLPGGAIQPGSSCNVFVSATNAPEQSALFVVYLK